MFGQHFYHKSIRNTVIAFGTIFNNMLISDDWILAGTPLQTIRVPYHMHLKKSLLQD